MRFSKLQIGIAALGLIVVLAGITIVAIVKRDADGRPPERRVVAIVEDLHKEQRQHTRRIRKGVYVPSGHPYTIFVVNLNCADGKSREMHVDYMRYTRLHRGDTAVLLLKRHLFGFETIVNDSTKWRLKHRERRKHCNPFEAEAARCDELPYGWSTIWVLS